MIPFAPIVTVAPTAPTDPVDFTFTEDPPPPPLPPPGEVGELPPHADITINAAMLAACAARIRLPKITVHPPVAQPVKAAALRSEKLS
jgi:hypothetical protein